MQTPMYSRIIGVVFALIGILCGILVRIPILQIAIIGIYWIASSAFEEKRESPQKAMEISVPGAPESLAELP